MMTLKDCTKAELLWIIDRLRNRGLYRLEEKWNRLMKV